MTDSENIFERRTAIIARVLKQQDIDFAALSETRLSDESQLTKDGAGHTFYWIGKPEGQPRLAGVGFAVRTSLPDHLASLPIGINEQLMTMRIHLANSRHMTVMSVYAPAVTHSDDAKEEFYEILSRTVSSIPPGDKIMILGDFNARVGQSTIAWGGASLVNTV